MQQRGSRTASLESTWPLRAAAPQPLAAGQPDGEESGE
jgi:hypothetical protein